VNNTEKDKNTIKQILYNNKYDTSILNQLIPTKNKKDWRKRKNQKVDGPNSSILIKKQNLSQNYSKIPVSKSPSKLIAL
jgi:hypothetical protein